MWVFSASFCSFSYRAQLLKMLCSWLKTQSVNVAQLLPLSQAILMRVLWPLLLLSKETARMKKQITSHFVSGKGFQIILMIYCKFHNSKQSFWNFSWKNTKILHIYIFCVARSSQESFVFNDCVKVKELHDFWKKTKSSNPCFTCRHDRSRKHITCERHKYIGILFV